MRGKYLAVMTGLVPAIHVLVIIEERGCPACRQIYAVCTSLTACRA
jgi:hypothetical protein